MSKRPLRFGIKTAPQYATYDEILAFWQQAEEIPAFEHAWIFDHFFPIGGLDPSGPCLEGWTLLAALAARTRRLRVGVMVTGNTYRHPAVLAKMGATVDIIANGRMDFGIGAGWNEQEHTAYGIPLYGAGERIHRMGEACAIIKQLWTQEKVDFTGRYYQLQDAYCTPKPLQQPHPPFVIGGAGEKLTLRYVAQYADIWNAMTQVVSEFRQKSAILDTHCAAIGRDPGEIERSVQLFVDTTDVETSRARVNDFIEAGATHIIFYCRPPYDPHVLRLLASEIAEPLRAAYNASISSDPTEKVEEISDL